MDSQMGLRADGNRMILVHNVAELQGFIDRKELQNCVVTVSKERLQEEERRDNRAGDEEQSEGHERCVLMSVKLTEG